MKAVVRGCLRPFQTYKGVRLFSTVPGKQESLPEFLSGERGKAIDILHAESQDILFNLATEEYMYEHTNIVNPVLFLWRNKPTIIIGKHQNPWKECRV